MSETNWTSNDEDTQQLGSSTDMAPEEANSRMMSNTGYPPSSMGNLTANQHQMRVPMPYSMRAEQPQSQVTSLVSTQELQHYWRHTNYDDHENLYFNSFVGQNLHTAQPVIHQQSESPYPPSFAFGQYGHSWDSDLVKVAHPQSLNTRTTPIEGQPNSQCPTSFHWSTNSYLDFSMQSVDTAQSFVKRKDDFMHCPSVSDAPAQYSQNKKARLTLPKQASASLPTTQAHRLQDQSQGQSMLRNHSWPANTTAQQDYKPAGGDQAVTHYSPSWGSQVLSTHGSQSEVWLETEEICSDPVLTAYKLTEAACSSPHPSNKDIFSQSLCSGCAQPLNDLPESKHSYGSKLSQELKPQESFFVIHSRKGCWISLFSKTFNSITSNRKKAKQEKKAPNQNSIADIKVFFSCCECHTLTFNNELHRWYEKGWLTTRATYLPGSYHINQGVKYCVKPIEDTLDDNLECGKCKK